MAQDVQSQLRATISSAPVVVFMKGSHSFPECGFSAKACQLLEAAGAAQITTVDVLSHPEIRQGIKEMTGWPTIPQVFIRGEFVGGADVVGELYESGQLRSLIAGASAS